MSVIDKTVHLSEERARRLGQLAAATGSSEDALVEKALDLLFGFWDPEDSGVDRRGWAQLGLPALEQVWENDADAAYDNWKELYGVPDR